MNTNGPGTLAAESPHQARLRACATCSRAKAKCVSGGDIAGKCQRCSRLNKPCEAPPSRARAAPKKRAPLQTSRVSKNQVAVLEEKLDGLVYLLKATKESRASAMVTPPQSRHAPTTSTPSQGAEEVPTDPEAEVWDERLHNGGSIQQRFALPPVDPLPMQPFLTMAKEYPLPDFDLGSEDPDVLLNIFRHEMKASFPFITTPDHVSAQELRRTRPAFFTTIMAVTTRVTSQQKVISAVVMKQLAERIVTDGERNLDLLLATLTYSAWCYYYFLNHTQFTVLLSLTTTLVADMRLNRPAPKYGSEARIAALQISRGYPPLPSLEKTPETHRALLGYWYLNSIISGFFHKLETIPWTDHLESSCQTLAASLDADDKSAATLIRLQLVSERINQSPWHGKVFSSSPGPPVLYIHSLKQQLHDLKTTLNAELEGNFCIPLAYWHAEISLYKIGLSKSPLLCDFLGHDFDRLECLHSCLQAVKSFFDTWLSIPTSMCHCLSVPMITHFTWSLGVLQLLATFNHPDWNLEWAREKISFTDILDKHAKKFAEAKTVLGLDPHTAIGEDIFSHSARRMAWMKSYFETDGAHARLNPLPPCLMPVDAPEFPQGIDMDFMDDEWMRDMLELW